MKKWISLAIRNAAYSALMLALAGTMSDLFGQWIAQSSGTTEQLNDIAVVYPSTAIVVGNHGTILKTIDAGTSWMPKASGTTRDLRSTAFYSYDTDGYAVGNGVVCYSTDRGDTWSADSSLDNFTVVEYGALINPDVYMGTTTGLVRFRAFPGSPWRQRELSGGHVVSIGLQYGPAQTTFATVATSDFAYIAYGAAPAWDSVAIPLLPPWDVVTGGDLRGFVQYLVGWGGDPGPFPHLWRRESLFDSSWQRIDLPGTYFPHDVKSPGQGPIVYVCGSEEAIYRSIDTGATWALQYGNPGQHGPILRAMAFRNDTTGYAVGDSGTILFTRNGGVTPVGPGEGGVPGSAFLYQNYPNPFNPSTRIGFEVTGYGLVSLKVYDMLGREVATLVREHKPPGSYQVEFDARTLSTGIYIYRLTVGGFSQSRKLIVVR